MEGSAIGTRGLVVLVGGRDGLSHAPPLCISPHTPLAYARLERKYRRSRPQKGQWGGPATTTLTSCDGERGCLQILNAIPMATLVVVTKLRCWCVTKECHQRSTAAAPSPTRSSMPASESLEMSHLHWWSSGAHMIWKGRRG